MEEQTQHRTTSSTRLRFVLGDRARDLALPADVPMADLLPAILTQFGAEAIEQGAEHEGWVVQRIGEPPLDEDRTLVELSVVDGESLHFRPRAEQLAAIDYDDLVDGLAEQVREHPGALTPTRVRWMFQSGAVVTLLLGYWLLLASGAAGPAALLSGGLVLALLVAGALVARGAAKSAPAVVLTGGGVGYAALAGLFLVTLLDPAASWMMRLTGAAASALLALLAGLIVVADAALLFAGAAVFTGVLLITGLIGSVSPATPAEATAIGLVLSLILGLFIPPAAFRLSGLSLPMLPTGAEDLHEDIDPVPHKVVVDRGATTFGYSTALHTGLGAAQSVLLPVLIVDGDVWHVVLSLVVALLLFLRSRHPNGVLQRWAVLAPAGLVVLMVLASVGLSRSDDTPFLVLVVVALALVAGLFLLGGERLPGQRFRPYWGRAVEIFELITAIAILPILLQVLHVYTFMRNLAG
ncbi:type VII secretion integral membrane protein EccD [Amycolatopsis lurida]|uniref:Integral membrane protein n=1 Tax=Amycolatopsis lurida NRRL 2430 TaxID=1460371 RepID=A0A2P2FF68_AMYLU|nr:type VII secretion integral membrane protein EccD [Amycolatopsis lurida]KFU75367.1 integral membrane protein [Amycolatopsis lurida NRRL 2430]SEE32153.1 type VII secretion integral membrane protein EccD [Amycolatopsis lurida]